MSHRRLAGWTVARTARRLLPAMLLAAASAACSAAGSSGSPPPDGSQVAVRGRAFEPSPLAVTAGDTVTWVWKERKPHNVSGEGFDSGDKRSGSFRHTFGEPGTYPYRCTLHAGMDGVVVVRSGTYPPAPLQPTTGRGP